MCTYLPQAQQKVVVSVQQRGTLEAKIHPIKTINPKNKECIYQEQEEQGHNGRLEKETRLRWLHTVDVDGVDTGGMTGFEETGKLVVSAPLVEQNERTNDMV